MIRKKSSRIWLGMISVSLLLGLQDVSQAKDFYKFGSFPPGTSPYIVNTAWAKAVKKYVPGSEIQLLAPWPATQHQLLVTEGKMDFFMGAPTMVVDT